MYLKYREELVLEVVIILRGVYQPHDNSCEYSVVENDNQIHTYQPL